MLEVCPEYRNAGCTRTEIPPWLRERDPDEVAGERAAELRERVHGFLDSVERT